MKLSLISNLTFQNRLILGIAILLFLTTFSLSYVGNKLAEEFMLKRFKDRMEFLAKYLAANTELGILLDDKEMLKKMASNLLKEKDVIEVKVYNAQNRLLAQAGENKLIDAPNKVSANVTLSATSETLAFGIDTNQNKNIGRVEITYVTSSIKELTNRLKERYILLTLVIAGISIGIFLIFAKGITAPLSRLIEAAQEVASGNLDVKLEEGSLPETQKLAKAFNTMIEALKQSRKDLEETYQKLIQEKSLSEIGHFAVTVAHEVKNPLGIIKGALDVLKKKEIEDDIRKTMIAYVEDEIQRLNNLIKDFLDFSRPKPLKFKQVNLKELLEEIVSRMEIEWAQKGIRLNLVAEEVSSIQADREALSRALINIIRNGCEVSEKGQHVEIHLFKKEHRIIITIADNGPGIPVDKKDKIFEPFFTEKSKGTGLGLTLSKKIIDAHMGFIEVLDNIPKGTKIKIILGS